MVIVVFQEKFLDFRIMGGNLEHNMKFPRSNLLVNIRTSLVPTPPEI